MTRRYLTASSRERLVVSRVVSSLGLGILAVLGVLWFQDAQATLFHVAPFGLVGLSLIVGSQILGRKNYQYLRVDLATRQATFVAKGKDRWSAPLDEVGPIVCLPFERRRKRNNVTTEITEYQAVISGRKDLALHQSSGYPASRRFAFRLAREWGVGLRGLDGHVRKAQDLEKPLTPGPSGEQRLDPDTGVKVERDGESTALRSTVLPATAGLPDLFTLGGAFFAWMFFQELHGSSVLQDPFFDPLRTAGVLVVAGLGVAAALTFGYQAWRFLQPAALRVDGTHLRYRGRSMPLAEIREIVSAGKILAISNRAHLVIPAAFCNAAATPAVVRAIRQLVSARAAAMPAVD